MRTPAQKTETNFYSIIKGKNGRAYFAEQVKEPNENTAEIEGKNYLLFTRLTGKLVNFGFDEINTSSGKTFVKFSFVLAYENNGKTCKHVVSMFDGSTYAYSFYEKICFLDRNVLKNYLENLFFSFLPFCFNNESGKEVSGLNVLVLPTMETKITESDVIKLTKFHSSENPLPVTPVTTKKGSKTLWNFEPVTAYYTEQVERSKTLFI